MRSKNSDKKPKSLPDFVALLESGDWNRISQELATIFDAASYDHIDAIEFGANSSIGTWIEVLVRTGLFTAHPKGAYIFKKICGKIWRLSCVNERWRLIVCFARVLNVNHIDESNSNDEFQSAMLRISEATGINFLEIITVISAANEANVKDYKMYSHIKQ
ncbi:MAG: hypothetical protein HY795_07295 [Desulfovibrio sp.]|nr:hypothetical protein [Desulfovibrio sp.]MBI4960799.1 hypothetical protein [Desulfovibrio sp.]